MHFNHMCITNIHNIKIRPCCQHIAIDGAIKFLSLQCNPDKYRREEPVPMETLICCVQNTIQVLEVSGV